MHHKFIITFLTNTVQSYGDLITRIACLQYLAPIGTVIRERASATTLVSALPDLLERTARTVSSPRH